METGIEKSAEVMPAQRTNWLRTLCATGLTAFTHRHIAEPFSAIIGGHRYVGATQGIGITLMLAQQDEDARLFAVPLDACGFNAASVCWGTCGKGIMGGIDVDGMAAIPCTVRAAQCPHFEKEMAEPWGTVNDGRDDDRPVYLRKLQREPHKVRYPVSHYLKAAWRWLRYMPYLPRRTWWRFEAWKWPRCPTCPGLLAEHKPMPPTTDKTILNRSHMYGDRLRVEWGDILSEVHVINCDGTVGASILLFDDDVEELRDALDLALENMKRPAEKHSSEKQSESP